MSNIFYTTSYTWKHGPRRRVQPPGTRQLGSGPGLTRKQLSGYPSGQTAGVLVHMWAFLRAV